MSLFVRVHVNEKLLGEAEIVNKTAQTGRDVSNTYEWTYRGDAGRILDGTIRHRYGDGAIVLANRVLGDIASRYQVVAHLDHRAGGVEGCPICIPALHEEPR